MTSSEIKEQLLFMHNRDKRLTFIVFGITAVVAIAFISFIIIMGRTLLAEQLSGIFGPEAPFFYKLVIPALILGGIIALYIKIKKIQNRPQVIETLIEKLENGAIADSFIVEDVRHKIVIAVRGWGQIKLLPIDYIKFALKENPSYNYDLPVNSSFVAELKTLMSGVNVEKMASLRKSVYNNNDTSDDK